MQLKDFSIDKSWLNILSNMNIISKEKWESIIYWSGWSDEEITKIKGVNDILVLDDPSKLKIARNGTIVYKDKQVVVYIRDQYKTFRDESGYKFHLMCCKHIQEKIDENRFDTRYVATVRDDGYFLTNTIDNNIIIEKNVMRKLDVCKACLRAVNYKNIVNSYPLAVMTIVKQFKIKDFYNLYKIPFNEAKTLKNSNVAHANVYSPYRTDIKQYKRRSNYTCPKCGINLENDKSFLTAHHIDGDKTNNTFRNIKVLCIACHSEEYQHEHLKQTDAYKQFIAKYGHQKHHD